jgi:hypothetical protein
MSKNGKSPAKDPETAFLAEQSKAARQALGTVVKEIESNLARSADVRAWAARYPWPTVAAATAVGFGAGLATAAAVHPQKSQSNGVAEEQLEVDAGGAHAELKLQDRPGNSSSKVVGGLRWLAGGLAAAAGEALFAATRKQLESALTQQEPADRPTNGRPKV